MNPEVRVLASAYWARGGDGTAAGALDVLPEGLSFHPAPDPPRPDAIDPGIWRRLSRLGRLTAAVAAPALTAPPRALDLDTLFIVFGTGIGEFSSSMSFLRSLFQRGVAGASPLAFQTSVHNAAPGQLAIALGLRGPMETLSAGDATAGHALLRGALHVAAHGGPALVLVADELGPDVQVGLTYGREPRPYSEGAAAFLLDALPDGTADRGTRLRFRVERSAPGAPARAFDPANVCDGSALFGAYPAVPAVALVARLRAGSGTVRLGGGIQADVLP